MSRAAARAAPPLPPLRVVIENTRGQTAYDVGSLADAAGIERAFASWLRAALAASEAPPGRCVMFKVTVHQAAEACDHES